MVSLRAENVERAGWPTFGWTKRRLRPEWGGERERDRQKANGRSGSLAPPRRLRPGCASCLQTSQGDAAIYMYTSCPLPHLHAPWGLRSMHTTHLAWINFPMFSIIINIIMLSSDQVIHVTAKVRMPSCVLVCITMMNLFFGSWDTAIN